MSEDENEDAISKIMKTRTKKKRKVAKNEFIDDEAELSGDDEVSEDEDDLSDDDQADLDLVDKEAPELDSEEEEEVRGLYHKQLESEDKRAVLLLQEQLEDKDVSVGQRRRRKFRWQTKELMENSLRRHYDPDDDDSQEGDDGEDDDDIDYDDLKPRLRRPTAESILIGSTRITSNYVPSMNASTSSSRPVAGPSSSLDDDSNSDAINGGGGNSRVPPATMTSTIAGSRTKASSDLNRFLFRDKEIVEALSTRETVIVTREEKDRNIQREIKKVLQSKSIFDQLYS